VLSVCRLLFVLVDRHVDLLAGYVALPSESSTTRSMRITRPKRM